MENWCSHGFWEKVIDEEVKKAKDPDTFPRALIDRGLRGKAEFDILAGPDNPGIHCPGNLSFAIRAQAGFHRKFSHKDHPVKGSSKPYIILGVPYSPVGAWGDLDYLE